MEFDMKVDRVISGSGNAERSSTRVCKTNRRAQTENHLDVGQRMEIWR